YRRMLNAFSAAVKRVDPANTVITAGTAPNGDPRAGAGRMTPVRFWQELLCLGTGDEPKPQPCPDPAHFDVLAHHPLSVTDPDVAAADPGNAATAALYNPNPLPAPAARPHRTTPPPPLRLWTTELNWDSGRPPAATPEQLQRWIPRALFRLWRD